MTKTISINQFRVKIYDTRAEMGFCAADEAAAPSAAYWRRRKSVI